MLIIICYINWPSSVVRAARVSCQFKPSFHLHHWHIKETSESIQSLYCDTWNRQHNNKEEQKEQAEILWQHKTQRIVNPNFPTVMDGWKNSLRTQIVCCKLLLFYSRGCIMHIIRSIFILGLYWNILTWITVLKNMLFVLYWPSVWNRLFWFLEQTDKLSSNMSTAPVVTVKHGGRSLCIAILWES